MAILDKNAIIERIKALSKEQGYSLNYMYKQLLLPSGYLRDVNANKTALTEERISAIASFLKTTPEYLKGETDIKEKPGIFAELSERDIRIFNIMRKLSDEQLDALELDLYRKGLL